MPTPSLLFGALLILLLAGCTQRPVARPETKPGQPTLAVLPGVREPSPVARPERQIKVGLVTSAGKIDDRSFNQSAWEALQRAQRELGVNGRFIEAADSKDYSRNIDQFAQDNYDVVITVGFAIGQSTQQAALKYPTVRFIGVDQYQDKPLDNLAGLSFEEDKAGFLAGALAGLMTRTGVVGVVLGTDVVPPVVKFGRGYEAGARQVRPEVKVLTAYHPGGLARGFSDPDWGKATAQQMIQQQADLLFAAGGGTGNGALLGALEGNVLAIGVDTDQWETLPRVRPVLLSSAMKLITPGVYGLINSVIDGTFKGGNTLGEVGLAPFHDTESRVPAEVKARLLEIERDLREGSISTGVKVP